MRSSQYHRTGRPNLQPYPHCIALNAELYTPRKKITHLKIIYHIPVASLVRLIPLMRFIPPTPTARFLQKDPIIILQTGTHSIFSFLQKDPIIIILQTGTHSIFSFHQACYAQAPLFPQRCLDTSPCANKPVMLRFPYSSSPTRRIYPGANNSTCLRCSGSNNNNSPTDTMIPKTNCRPKTKFRPG